MQKTNIESERHLPQDLKIKTEELDLPPVDDRPQMVPLTLKGKTPHVQIITQHEYRRYSYDDNGGSYQGL